MQLSISRRVFPSFKQRTKTGRALRIGELRQAGNAARDQKNWALAVRCYSEVVGEDPTDLDIVIQLGHAHKENGDYDHAAQAYYGALSKKSGDYDLCLQIGHLEKLRNNFVEAVRFYKAAEILNPNNVDARGNLGVLLGSKAIAPMPFRR